MAMTHILGMTYARRLARVESIVEQDSAERAYNKLMRTFMGQFEALNRSRHGSEQKVTVVNLREQSQAIVGDVTQSASQPASGKTVPSPELPAEATAIEMTSVEGQRQGRVPGHRRERLKKK